MNDTTSLPNVRFFYRDAEIIPTDSNKLFARAIRRQLDGIARKQAKNFAHLVHPETGERPDVWIVVQDPSTLKAEVRLVTNSPSMNEWLQSKGVGVAASPIGITQVIHEKSVDVE